MRGGANRFEERLLRPARLGADAFGEIRVDHRVEAHVVEHRAIRAA